jgi:hypothetical protein
MLAKQHTSAENPAFFRDVALLNKSDRLLREVGNSNIAKNRVDNPLLLSR